MVDQATDPLTALRGLANRWTLLARDYARDAKAGDPHDVRTGHNRGLAEGYYKAAIDLAELIKSMPELTSRPASRSEYTPASAPRPAQPEPAAPSGQAAPAASAVQPTPTTQPVPAAPPLPQYLAISLSEALDVLTYAGTNPREVIPNKGVNTFTAIFSRWESQMPHERIEKLQKADFRIVIIESGKTKDNSDPYVEFAFRQP